MKMRNFILLLGLAGLLGLAFLIQSCDKILDEPDTEDTTLFQPGDTLWVHDVPQTENSIYFRHGFPDSDHLAVGSDGTVYYGASPGLYSSGTEQYRVYAIDKNTGKLKWQSEELWPKHFERGGIAIGNDGTVYAYAFLNLAAINPENGNIKWRWEVPDMIGDVSTYTRIQSLALLSNGDVVVKTDGISAAPAIYRLNSEGQEVWHLLFNDVTPSRLFIGKNDIIYTWWDEQVSGSDKTFLHAIDPENGQVTGKAAMIYGQDYRSSKIVVTDNGDVIFFRNTRNAGAPSDTIVRMSYDLKQTLWASAVEYVQSEDYSMVLFNGYIYFNGFNNCVVRVNAGNGQAEELTDMPWSAVVDNRGIFYGEMATETGLGLGAVTYDGTILNGLHFTYAYEAIKLGYDKVLYVATDHKIFALSSADGLSKNGWPCFQHDSRNSYNVNTR